jgi:hypothetical protein
MRRADESGFALLLVFLMASIVAIGLYYELPRVAMEAQRQKEQLLIERGEQYKRAIQLFFKKAGRYPSEIKELESFQNQRFLRHRYVDPMTGKDEWRLIHIQNGVLTDSLVSKPKGQGDQQASTLGQYIGMQAGALDAQGPQAGALNAKDRRRSSDGGNPMTGPDGQPLQTGSMPNSGPYPGQPPLPGAQPYPNGSPDPNAPQNAGSAIPGGQFNPATGNGPPPPPFPGQILGPNGGQLGGQPGGQPGGQFGGQPGGQPGLPGSFPVPQPPAQGGNTGGSYIGSQPYMGGGGMPGSNPGNPGGVTYPGQRPIPGQPFPGLPFVGQPGAPVNSQPGGVSPFPTQGNFPSSAQPGITTPPQGPSAAADMLNKILTTARPGGMPPGIGGQTIGGGMAGVASNGEGEGVMIYNDRTVYKEWEFIFDPSKVKPLQNPNAATGIPIGTPASQMGSMPPQSGMTPVGGGPLNQSPAGATPIPGPRPGQQ